MSQGKGRLGWNKFKWILFVTNSSMFFSLPLYNPYFPFSQILQVYDLFHGLSDRLPDDMVWHLETRGLGCHTCNKHARTDHLHNRILRWYPHPLIGWAGILLNNRNFLAWYTFLSWITFAFLATPGYIIYKRRIFNLEGKINAQWSRNLTTADRLQIQMLFESDTSFIDNLSTRTITGFRNDVWCPWRGHPLMLTILTIDLFPDFY